MCKLENYNRLGVFAMGDIEGIVDNYVLYLLDDMIKVLSKLIIVSYTKLTDEAYCKLAKYSDQIVYMDKAECDVAAWGHVIMEYMREEELKRYEEIVLFNDSFFGPISSFIPVFDEMGSQDVDFWGLTLCEERTETQKNQKQVDIPKHIQRYFMVYRKSVISGEVFREGWSAVLQEKTAKEMVEKYEHFFVQELDRAGYRWNTYIHLDELKNQKENMISYDEYMPDYMLIEKKSPILLKELFGASYENCIHYTGGESLARCMEYIEHQTTYDVNMIWDNVLRLYNISDLKQNLHLNYVLSNQCVKNVRKSDAKVAVVIHSYYVDLLDEIYHYAKQIPEYVDLYVTTGSFEKKLAIEDKLVDLKCKKFEVILTENRGRDLAALLVASRERIKKYDYVCFTHDKKTSGNAGPVTVGRSFFYTAIENVLSSGAYIENIIATLESNPRLGVLSPPGPLHSVYFGSLGREWTVCYEQTEQILKEFGVRANLSPEKQPFVLGTSLWFRTDALKVLLEKEWTHDDFPEEPLGSDGTLSHGLERAFPYFAQGRGYYSGWVMTEEYASQEIANLRYLLSNVIDVQQKKREPYIEYYYRDYMTLQRRGKYESGTLYYNFGKGYDEKWKTTVCYEISDEGEFRLEVDVPKEYRENIKEIRFDPVEGKQSIVILEHVMVDGKALGIARHNGVPISDCCQCFEDIDPYYIFYIDNRELFKIEIQGKIAIAGKEIFKNILRDYNIVSAGLYWDDGSGFTEGKCIRQNVKVKQNGQFEVIYRLRDIKEIESIRFDPLEGSMCKICLERLTCNGEEVLEYTSNGMIIGNGEIAFHTEDPWYVISRHFDYLNTVEVSGTISELQELQENHTDNNER